MTRFSLILPKKFVLPGVLLRMLLIIPIVFMVQPRYIASAGAVFFLMIVLGMSGGLLGSSMHMCLRLLLILNISLQLFP